MSAQITNVMPCYDHISGDILSEGRHSQSQAKFVSARKNQPWQHVGSVTNYTRGPEKGNKCKFHHHPQILKLGLETPDPVTFQRVYFMAYLLKTQSE